MAMPLLDKGYDVHLVSHAIPSYAEFYRSISLCMNIEQMKGAIRCHADADVFHVHNEPSYFVTLIKEIFPDKPVVLDVHDSYAARLTSEEFEALMEKGEYAVRVTAEERSNFQLADALVFPGERFRDIVTSEYALSQPNIVLPSYIPYKLYRYTAREWLGGLVYEGRVNLDKEIAEAPNMHGFKYCAYEKMAQEAHAMDMDFHLYTVRKDEEFKKAFGKYSLLHPPCAMPELLKNLSRHDWGIVGNVFPSTEWDMAFPNKLFDYMAAGIPTVAMNAHGCEEFVVKHGIGIAVKSLAELGERWSEHRKCRNNLLKKRQQFSMDAHIHLLETLYREVA
jgi:glycosyltransferase involved in cell wall biosynthesis